MPHFYCLVAQVSVAAHPLSWYAARDLCYLQAALALPCLPPNAQFCLYWLARGRHRLKTCQSTITSPTGKLTGTAALLVDCLAAVCKSPCTLPIQHVYSVEWFEACSEQMCLLKHRQVLKKYYKTQVIITSDCQKHFYR